MSTYCVPDIMFGPYYDSKPTVALLLDDLNCKGKEQMHSRKLKKVKEYIFFLRYCMFISDFLYISNLFSFSPTSVFLLTNIPYGPKWLP